MIKINRWFFLVKILKAMSIDISWFLITNID